MAVYRLLFVVDIIQNISWTYTIGVEKEVHKHEQIYTICYANAQIKYIINKIYNDEVVL